MADFVQFSITRLANANLSVPRWTVSGKVVDSKTQQTVLRDFTGGNVVTFPTILGQLTAAQQDTFVERIIGQMIFERYGIVG
jgi:hypothetical protein